MVLTEKQLEGLKIAVARYKQKEPWTCIAGFAGTGKSTLVSFVIEALGLDPEEDVAYATYTGKAALVLKEKGCPNAQTTHRLLYQSFPRADGTFYHKVKRPLDNDYKLIVVDEISMLPKEMWELLLSHRIHVIALGDPFQLPPIGDDNGVLGRPHIFLDQIMRQEEDNEIIRLSMDIREGKPLYPFKGKNVQIVSPREVVDGMFTWADQVIVGKNITRRNFNERMRGLVLPGAESSPAPNDKVICLKNEWNNLNALGDPLVNGLIGHIEWIRTEENVPFITKRLRMHFMPDDYPEVEAMYHNLAVDYNIFATGEPTINKNNFRRIPSIFHPLQFDYGYAITCWKAQGSEYNKVLLFEENHPFDKVEHQKYLYTGITRARDKIVIVKDWR